MNIRPSTALLSVVLYILFFTVSIQAAPIHHKGLSWVKRWTWWDGGDGQTYTTTLSYSTQVSANLPFETTISISQQLGDISVNTDSGISIDANGSPAVSVSGSVSGSPDLSWIWPGVTQPQESSAPEDPQQGITITVTSYESQPTAVPATNNQAPNSDPDQVAPIAATSPAATTSQPVEIPPAATLPTTIPESQATVNPTQVVPTTTAPSTETKTTKSIAPAETSSASASSASNWGSSGSSGPVDDVSGGIIPYAITYSVKNNDTTCLDASVIAEDIRIIALLGIQNVRVYATECIWK